MHLADKHNFGQQVEKVLRGSDHWYRKPRTVYWEWLFFGKTSPLKSLFNEKGQHNHRPLADYFFNLDIEIESTWSGLSKEVQAEVSAPTLEHFYAFGALIAYCFIFGIRDLHKQNLVMTKTHFQPVDVEVVFVTVNLPHETLLLPFKNIGYEFAGIGVLAEAKEEITKEQIEQLLLGYWDIFKVVSKQSLAVGKVLSELDFSKIPSRVIVRNTSEYSDFLVHLPKNALPSEIEQLKRGDVPFYFKFVGDKNLYWLKEKEFSWPEESLGIFQPDVDRHGNYGGNDWCQLRSNTQVMIQGMLVLLKHFELQSNLTLSLDSKIEAKTVNLRGQVFSFEQN